MPTTFYKDIDLNFTKTSTGDFPVVTDIDAIKVSLYNRLFVKGKENFFDEDFGYNIDQNLFEFTDGVTLVSIQNLIESAIAEDERIEEIEDLVIEVNETSNEIKANVKFRMVNLIEPQEVDLILKKTR